MNILRNYFLSKRTLSVTAGTPPIGILKRYELFQKDFPKHLVLMQVGDFYEIYGDAVEGAAKILDIATTRTPSKLDSNGPVAMTGFPIRSFDTFLSKLIRSGVSVVVADQVPIPDSTRFDRKVTRVITPGTIVEENLLDRNSNNYLLYLDGVALNCAWMDISTGDFFTATCTNESELLSLLARLKPREVLTESPLTGALDRFLKRSSTLVRQVEATDSKDAKYAHDFTGFTESELKISAKLLDHVRLSMQCSFALKPLKRFAPARHFMSIDADSYRSLDIFTSSSSLSWTKSSSATLFATLNECKTALGSRLLSRRLQAPFLDPCDIESALDSVESYIKLGRANLETLHRKLDQVGDIERILQRLCLRRPQAVSRDLRSLARSLLAASEAFDSLKLPLNSLKSSSNQQSLLTEHLLELIKRVTQAFNEKLPLRDSEGELFISGWDSELDNLRKLRDNSSEVFKDLAVTYRQISGVPNLRIAIFKGDQHVVEVAKSVSLPSDLFRPLVQTETRSRYTTEELLTKSMLLRSITDRVIDKELNILSSLLEPILQSADEIRVAADLIAKMDLESTFASLALDHSYTRPQLTKNKDDLVIVDGKHPVLDKLFTSFSDSNESLRHFTPNSLNFSSSHGKFLLLTGPNMGGKSTFLRQNALIVLMAQCGSFVPASSFKFHPIDAIFTRIGASDDLSRDKSTFMMEMSETAHILQNATPQSLVLIDEIGRGTSASEGLALAAAIAKHLITKNKSRVLFATHYHEITQSPLLEDQLPAIQMACTDAQVNDEDGSVLLIPKVKPGLATHSFALPVASLAGIPQSVINDARGVLK